MTDLHDISYLNCIFHILNLEVTSIAAVINMEQNKLKSLKGFCPTKRFINFEPTDYKMPYPLIENLGKLISGKSYRGDYRMRIIF